MIAATQANVAVLQARGHAFIGPEAGMQACGYEGIGRLWPVEGIIAAAEKVVEQSGNTTTALSLP